MLYYETHGKLTSRPLIFLHGFLGSRVDCFPIIEELERDYFCTLVDLPAHGKSPYTTPIISAIKQSIESIHALTEQKPLLIGYSLGGRIALQISQDSKTPICGVFAFSAHPGLATEWEKKERLRADRIWQNRLQTLEPKQFLTLWYEQTPFASLRGKVELLEKLYKERDLSHKNELSLVLEEMSLAKQPLISHSSLPLRLGFGEEDVKYKILYQNSLFAQVSIPKAGHTVFLENPKGCAEAIKTFIDTI